MRLTPSWTLLQRMNEQILNCFLGVSTGGSCVVAPMFISEYAETSIRGLLGTFFQLFLTIGILMVFVLGAVTTWVNLSWACFVIPVIYMVGLFFVPESPYWLVKNVRNSRKSSQWINLHSTFMISQGRQSEAAAALKWFWGRHCNANAAIQSIQNDINASGGSGSVRDLLSVKSNRNGFIISLALMFFQQFSGINAVIFFTVPIFKSAGSNIDPALSAIIVGVVQVLMTFCAAALVERAGRKVLLLQSSTIMCLCLAVLGVYFRLKKTGHDVSNIGWIPLLCLVLFIVSFSLGYGPIPWMMMGELLAPEVKSIATSFTVLFNWIAVFIVTKTFPTLNDSLGSDITFWIFAVLMAMGTIYGFKSVFETKGKSSTEIQFILSGEKRWGFNASKYTYHISVLWNFIVFDKFVRFNHDGFKNKLNAQAWISRPCWT